MTFSGPLKVSRGLFAPDYVTVATTVSLEKTPSTTPRISSCGRLRAWCDGLPLTPATAQTA